MKKYAIIIGEDNEELSKKVQEALSAVGIKWDGGQPVGYNAHVEVLGVGYWGRPSIVSMRGVMSEIGLCEILLPSYVIANAAELDGAKKPFNRPQDGYRMATDEERKDHAFPTDCEVRINAIGNRTSFGTVSGWLIAEAGDWENIVRLDAAIPSDYTWKKPWQIAPEGYRFVTDEELATGDCPMFSALMGYTSTGWGHRNSYAWRDGGANNLMKALAVPIDFTFEPRKVTMAQVCEKFGEDVVIEKE